MTIATTTPTPNAVPKADALGKINPAWVDIAAVFDDVTDVSISDTTPTTIDEVPPGILAASWEVYFAGPGDLYEIWTVQAFQNALSEVTFSIFGTGPYTGQITALDVAAPTGVLRLRAQASVGGWGAWARRLFSVTP